MPTTPVGNEFESNMVIKPSGNSDDSVSQENTNGGDRVIAKLSGSDFEYFINKDKVVIGRNSSHGKVDVSIGLSSYVSRKHLQITYEHGRFFLGCLGKNGVFVDGQFQRFGANPLPLDKACVIRFPSTNICLSFVPFPSDLQHTNEHSNQKPHTNISIAQDEIKPLESTVPLFKAAKSLPPAFYADNQIKENTPELLSSSSLKSMLPKRVPGFLSAPPSPTGTISALNSCPASPRSGPSHFQHSIIGDNLTAAVSAMAATVEDQNEKGCSTEGIDSKPPYSYAQLIIQAISSAPQQQLTLSGIYAHITKHYPYYRTADKGWQNSIRHNLSLNRYFVKVPRSQEESGKGSFWKVESTSEKKLLDQAWRKRRQRAVPCFCAPFTTTVSTITRSAPVSPEHSSRISPSLIPGVRLSSQEEPSHHLSKFDSDSKHHMIALDTRYPQSAPGSPSKHAVALTAVSDSNAAAGLQPHRFVIITSANNVSSSESGRVMLPLQPINTQPQGAQLHYTSAAESVPKLSPNFTTVSSSTYTANVQEKMPAIVQLPTVATVNPTSLTAFTVQQHQQLLQQQQQAFQQQVVMVAGQNAQVPQAIPITIGTLVAAATAPTSVANATMPFAVPGTPQYVVKRVNDHQINEAVPAKKAKTEDLQNPNDTSAKAIE